MTAAALRGPFPVEARRRIVPERRRYPESRRDLRVEASIAIDRLPDFYDVPDHSLGTKRDRADKVLRAMFGQFLSQDPDIRPGELKRIGEQDVDVAPIINQF